LPVCESLANRVPVVVSAIPSNKIFAHHLKGVFVASSNSPIEIGSQILEAVDFGKTNLLDDQTATAFFSSCYDYSREILSIAANSAEK